MIKTAAEAPMCHHLNKGIACGLQNIQKIKDGESLGGKVKAEDEFNDGYQTEADDDFLG